MTQARDSWEGQVGLRGQCFSKVHKNYLDILLRNNNRFRNSVVGPAILMLQVLIRS